MVVAYGGITVQIGDRPRDLSHAIVSAPPAAACSGTRAPHRLDIHTDIPALPFARVRLRGQIPKPVLANYPSVLKTLGDHIQKKRLDLGLTWKAVAKQIGAEATSVA